MELLRIQGYANVLGGLTLPNEGSQKLHESMGFRKIGHFSRVGYKFDQWWDTEWWEKTLIREGDKLSKPRTLEELGDDVIEKILFDYASNIRKLPE